MSTETISPGITRFEFEKRKGYMVRIKRRTKRKNIWIPDKKFGGKRKALAEAKRVYEELLDKLGPIKPSTKNKITVRNRTGQVGVHMAMGYDTRWKTYNEMVIATWTTDDGTRDKISFAAKKYGRQQAFELACLAREKQISNRAKVLELYERQKKSKKGAKSKALRVPPPEAVPTKKKAAKKKAAPKKAAAKKVAKKKAAKAPRAKAVKKTASKKAPAKKVKRAKKKR